MNGLVAAPPQFCADRRFAGAGNAFNQIVSDAHQTGPSRPLAGRLLVGPALLRRVRVHDGTQMRMCWSLGGSPGRIRTSDMTVNSRPLYRLSYRGVLSEILLLSARHREIKRWRIDIIASEYVYESIVRIVGT